jgi:hypothetical protein
MIANGGSAGDGLGIYRNPARQSAYVNGIILLNCEGPSKKYSSMITGSTFHHWFKTALEGNKFCAW